MARQTASVVARYAAEGCRILFDSAVLAGPTAAWFDPRSPELGAVAVAAGGRAAAWFVTVQGRAAVLRHYRRGGLAARFVRETYFWRGADSTRAFAEFDLMRKLWQSGSPVPRPLAAAVWRHGFTYRAAILTERIVGAVPLAATHDPAIWRAAGVVIAGMHRLGVWHADLNVYNVLVGEGARVWLIDFDKGRIGRLTATQRSGNLARLLRSVRKVVPALEPTCWSALIQGYDARWQDSKKEL
jgi:3-deoxy-D-manno-octulosonic acid kinase